ncbi:hypothetical protein AVEN_49707-1 [Araneus ventricosus]|uniref:Uncharacterized protein n=1 Tax=Araneus ventricosus TaxID=182803 RepID=A0A4Y2VDG6_ARAVE|nr:hypothetical protein AVEN_15314-1 [Araneus ventricosus]GBO21819.1 hypothetical protein AVEN_35063-1 [Araneus ventricosus]GBO22135.1 hypothetical protein AVEN_49707-1 [Araneus ventricosus]
MKQGTKALRKRHFVSIMSAPKCLNKKHLQLHWFPENYNYRVGLETPNGVLRCLVNTLPCNSARDSISLSAQLTARTAGSFHVVIRRPLFYMRVRRSFRETYFPEINRLGTFSLTQFSVLMSAAVDPAWGEIDFVQNGCLNHPINVRWDVQVICEPSL